MEEASGGAGVDLASNDIGSCTPGDGVAGTDLGCGMYNDVGVW